MTNKTFKEEVIQKWFKTQSGYIAVVNIEGGYTIVILDGMFNLEELLDLQKQKILEALPQSEQEKCPLCWSNNLKDCCTFSQGRQAYRLEVKQIIENI